ncbi:MAG TPA: RIP metalloprotease RseP [Terriglobales bacterium]|nr:RIP metalloprotease RseP [Terriglobales bacterium]
MNHILVNTLAVAVVLGVIVFVHELGHFLAAKAFGVRVETFSLGFGTRLFGVRYGPTDYRISLLPLGGYVKMAGENPLEERSGQPDEFLSKSRWQRFIIALAGPFMNAVLAVGLLIPAYMREFPRNPVLDSPAVVAEVQPDSPAAKAGIRPKDRIVNIDGASNPTWETMFLKTAVSVDHPLDVTLNRQGAIVHTKMTPVSDGPDNPPLVGLAPAQTTRFGDITAGSPAAAAGLAAGDQVVRANGEEVLDPGNLVDLIQQSEPDPKTAGLGAAGRPVSLELLRGGHTLSIAVTPKLQDYQERRQWMIGAAFVNDTTIVQLPFGEALRQSLDENKQYSMVILDLVGKLVERQASIQNLQGPVGIASVTGDAARSSSLLPLFQVTSLISLNLGILNLLPIPVLDGGMIMFLFIEGIMRHEISLKVKERVYQVGFAFLLILMTVVVYNDIVRAVVVQH